MRHLVTLGIVRFLLDVQFWYPTWMLLLLDRGFSAGQISAVDAVHYLVIVVSEVPAGWLSDRIGRRATLLLGCLLTIPVFCGIAMVSSTAGALAVWAAWGVLWALSSGAETAYTWELAQQTAAVDPARFLGSVRVVSGVSAFVSVLVAGPMLEFWTPLPYVVTAVLAALAALLVLTLPETNSHSASPSSRGWDGAVRTVRGAQRRGDVIAAITAMSALFTVGISIRILYQPLGAKAGFSATEISLLYGGLAIAAGLGAFLAARVRPQRAWTAVTLGSLLLASALVGVGIALADKTVLLATVLLAVSSAAFLAVRTLLDVIVLRAVGPRRRATVLSIASAASGMAMVATRPIVLLADETWGSAQSFIGYGLTALAICALLVLLLRPRVRSSTSDEPEASST